MQKAEDILSILRRKSIEDANYKFDRLYRNLFNEDFYLRAYNKIYVKEVNMATGFDKQPINRFNLNQIEEIVGLMKSENYYPTPVVRENIPENNGKTRVLRIPNFIDNLVQEILRQILEAIYEPIFLNSSHGFRPNRSCHTALMHIKTMCKGTNWVIEGNIKEFFDNISHDIMIKILSKKISDGRFLELIKRFLKSGYFEFKQVYNTLSGISQCGIISQILVNLYLHELDKFMDKICKEYSTDNTRKDNLEYQQLNSARYIANKIGKYKKAYELLQKMRNLQRFELIDDKYIKVNYIRYADNFVVCIIGSKELAKEIRGKISIFLADELKLELSLDKTVITNLSDKRLRFLGYEISKKTRNNTIIMGNTLDIKGRLAKEAIQLIVPNNVLTEKLKPFMKNGKSIHYGARVNMPILDIISKFNAEIRDLYNYYALATDVSTKIGKFKYYHYKSLAKTIARKEKCSVKKVIDKYGVEVKLKHGTGTRKIIGTQYQTKKDSIKIMVYFNEPLNKKYLPC